MSLTPCQPSKVNLSFMFSIQTLFVFIEHHILATLRAIAMEKKFLTIFVSGLKE
jgi:hypothetical protein